VNLQGAYTFSIAQETVQLTENRITGLLVDDPNSSGFPYTGLHPGDAECGFYGVATITHDEGWNWWIAWGDPVSEQNMFYPWSDGSFYAGGWYVDYCVGFDEWNYPIQLTIASGSPFDGTYYGDEWVGFYCEGEDYSLTKDGCGNWWMNLPWTECVALGNFGAGEVPTGNFTGGSNEWSFSIAPYREDVTWQETHPVTNAVSFEAADGRYAWVGNHNAGGFNLGKRRHAPGAGCRRRRFGAPQHRAGRHGCRVRRPALPAQRAGTPSPAIWRSTAR
jgi:hypothetical protein